MLELIKARATLIVFLLGVASTIGFGWWCYDAGKTAERSDWQTKQNDELVAKNKQLQEDQTTILRLQTERDEAEDALAIALAKKSQEFQQDVTENDNETEATINKLLTDNERLQRNLRLSEAQSATAELTATTLGHYAAGQARLSDEAVRFLGKEAGRANRVAIQLGSCQKVVAEYYQKVNAYNEKYFGVVTKF